jgi:uncharacterized protein
MSQEFWPFYLGGLALGSVATLYPLLGGRLLGVSSLYTSLFEKKPTEDLQLAALEAALLAETEAEFGPSNDEVLPTPTLYERLARLRAEAERYRPLFLAGMVLGAAGISLLAGSFEISSSLGERFDIRYGEFGIVPLLVLAVSGVLIGFGTRLAGGCTSGHGISGVARLQPGSLLSTLTFWATALGVAWLFAALRGA